MDPIAAPPPHTHTHCTLEIPTTKPPRSSSGATYTVLSPTTCKNHRVSSDLGLMEHKPLPDAPSTNSSQRQEWTPCNPSVLHQQEAGYSPGTDSLPCSSALMLPPTPHIASLIMETKPSVICFLFPRSQLQLRSLRHILNSACSEMSDPRRLCCDLLPTLPHNTCPGRSGCLHCLKPVEGFPSEPGFPASRAEGTLKSQAEHIL